MKKSNVVEFKGDVVVLREELVYVTGDPETAMVLGQMLYWTEHTGRQGKEFFKSALELSQELFGLYKPGKVAKLLKALVDKNLISRWRDKNPFLRIYWYRVNNDEITKRLQAFEPDRNNKKLQVNPIITTEESIITTEECILTTCENDRDHFTKNTNTESNPIPDRIRKKKKNQILEDDDPVTVSVPEHAYGSVTDFTAAVDKAMSKNMEMVRVKLWRKLDPELTKGRSLAQAFGSDPHIVWTAAEKGYLKEIFDFCRDRWPNTDPVTAVYGLIRCSFCHDGKPFQILKHWITHCKCRITLRPYLTLAGGANDPAKRWDILVELADSKTMVEFINQRARPE